MNGLEEDLLEILQDISKSFKKLVKLKTIYLLETSKPKAITRKSGFSANKEQNLKYHHFF